MTTVFKYPLTSAPVQTIVTPRLWHPLTVQIQNGVPCIWALTTTDDLVLTARRVLVVGTGRELPPLTTPDEYLGTVQEAGGALVWHVFVQRTP
jgi:hypothetical protein